MKKILLSFLALAATVTFSAEAKFKVEDVQNAVYSDYVASIVETGTNSFFVTLYNAKVAEYSEGKNLDLTNRETMKEVSEYALKEILSDLGYEAVLKFKDSNANDLELSLNIDKAMTELESAYFLNLINQVFGAIYGEGSQGRLRLYSDKALTTLVN